jgi:hypothetical protein
LPDLVGRGYVDVEPAHDIHLIVRFREPAGQDRACGVPGPVVWTGKGVRGISDRVVDKHAGSGRGLPSCGSAHAINERTASELEHATRHVVHLVVG